MSRTPTREDRDIAIVGISIFSPAGESVEQFWDGIARGGDFITDVPPDVIDPYHFEGQPNGIDRFYCKRGGFSSAFKADPLRYGILPVAASGIDPDQFISLAGAEQALIDADVFEKGISLQKCSIIIGRGNFSGVVPLRSLEIVRMARQFTELLRSVLPELTDEDLERVRKAYQERQGRYQADMSIGTMPNLIAALVANRFDMHGPAYMVDAACASGVLAIDHSVSLLRGGQCDVAIAGGMHTAHSAMFWGAFDMMGALSRRQRIAPFSEDADGLLIGQGGGFIVLKTLRKALEDGDRIYAVIKETAVSSDGGGSNVLVTNAKGQIRTLKMAWERAGMDPRRLGYVEAHGTATPVGDRTELLTLKEFFGDNTHAPALVGSVKSNIGHTMPAAGMIGVIKTALALYHRKIPPTLHCERPLAAMYESRFLPPQEPTDWDGEQYPLVAGVNAFGFGGTNSHAIMVAYEPTAGMPAQPRPRPWLGEALLVSAPGQEELIEKLRVGDYTNTGGRYRLALFDPDESRIEQAIRIVGKGKPWRGRMDIWFSNRPLLEEGGKVVFMCPGFGPEGAAETDSISEALDLPLISEKLAQEDDRESAQMMLRYYFITWLCREALLKLGIEPDIYIGHSTGEWNAVAFAGMTDGDWGQVYQTFLARVPLTRHPLIAVSGIDSQRIERWCAEIPGLYLANDNCPSQTLLCGEQRVADLLLERLNEERVFHTVLPYGSGVHTPLLEGEGDDGKFLAGIDVHEGHTPVWSSTTLEPIPTDKEEYARLVESQIRRPVHFRGLIEKLYREQDARVFIQLGLGALVGFVEDTLKGREFSAIAGNLSNRGGADQLRRVLAALFVEGREVDARFIGVKPLYRAEHNLMIMGRGAPPTISELPELTEAVRRRYGDIGARLTRDGDDTADISGDPILDAASANLREVSRTQNELVRLFEQTPRDAARLSAATAAAAQAVATTAAAAQAVAATAAAAQAVAATTTDTFPSTGIPSGSAPADPLLPPPNGSAGARTPAPSPPPHRDFKRDLRLTFEDHPYLVDHSIVRQPKDWGLPEDLNPVVPFTMTIELLAEIAREQAPGRKLVKVGKVTAYRWIGLETPFEESLEGVWKEPDLLELNLKDHAKAEFTFADEWPEPPPDYRDAVDVGSEIMDPVSAKVLYDRYAFHGPQYHSNKRTVRIGSRGIAGHAQKREGKGSLLDIMGQTIGLFLHLTQTRNTISFPVRLKELNLYADILDQDGSFEYTMRVTHLTKSSIAADVILRRDGRIWGVARDFVCQRFENHSPIWHVIREPQHSKLAEEIAPGVYFYSSTSQGNVLTLLSKRYLNGPDRAEAERFKSTSRVREHLISRIVLKDAVRDFVRKHAGADTDANANAGTGADTGADTGEMLYPIEIICDHDEKGKLLVRGYGRAARLLDGIHVSLSHKSDECAAIVAREPVGIDLERIEEKGDGFRKLAFTERERELLAPLRQPEASIRFWVAKEACAKKAGTGLAGDPRRFEVSAVDGDVLSVEDQKVRTARIGEEYVIGWTI